MLRKYVVQRQIGDQQITHLFGHHWIVYVPILGKILLFLVVLYGIYLLATKVSNYEHLDTLTALAGLAVYVHGMVGFLNYYLDSMVLTSRGVVVFKREGLLEYKTETFARDRIERVSHTQDSLNDKILQKGDITIGLEHGVNYTFVNVPNPKSQAHTVLQIKDRHDLPPIEDEEENDKFHLLVETLGEVIQDYMHVKKRDSAVHRHTHDDGMFH